jgi:hypothetical protein
MKKGNVILWSIAGVIVLALGGFFGVRAMVRANKVKPFKEHIPSYVQQPKARRPDPARPQPAAGKISGKLITVDVQDQSIDYLYFDLPDDLRADTPDQVGTVVQLRWSKTKVAEYTNGKPAYRQTCHAAVMNKGTGELVAEGDFQGGDPPSTIKSSQPDGTGSKPDKEVVDFLKRLPRE